MSDKEKPLEESGDQDEEIKKPSTIKAVLFSAISAAVMGASAAGAVFLFSPSSDECVGITASNGQKIKGSHAKSDVTYLNLEPLVITLGPDAKSTYLKISISLETTKDYEKTLNELTPRLRDALNSYLRAVDENDLVLPSAMTRLRAQMLRRLQLVGSEEAVIDVLITDFVLT